MNNPIQKYTEITHIVESLLASEKPWKLVFSKPRENKSKTKSITVIPAIIRGQKYCKCVFREEFKDITTNESNEAFIEKLSARLAMDFFNADIMTTDETYQCLQSKNGKITVLRKKSRPSLQDGFSHDREKKSYVEAEAAYYKKLGLISGSGHVFGKGQKKYNQVNKYLEVLSHLTEGFNPIGKMKVADMGSGKAYLTFAVYDFLRNKKKWDVEVTGYETRADLVAQCNAIAKESEYENLRFEQKSIDAVPPGDVNMVIALHACDIATDMAIAHGVKNKADFIILAPCCQKQIRKSMTVKDWLTPVLKNGILFERQAEILTDGMRALILEHHGYQTKVFEFISLEHTAKNVMITAQKGKSDPNAKAAFEKIKNEFGICEHYLEKILPF